MISVQSLLETKSSLCLNGLFQPQENAMIFIAQKFCSVSVNKNPAMKLSG
jgi:hypothetical protein